MSNSSNQPGFTPMFSDADLDRWYGIFTDKADEKILTLLKATGETFVKYAREIHTYEDVTGNLRSSIGYVIIQDGEEILSSEFEKVAGHGENSALVNFKTKGGGSVKFHAKGKSGDGGQGSLKGRQLAEAIALSYSKGMVVIGVAGMQYAAAVEAKGFDVVTGACQSAEAWMRKAIEETFKQAGENGR